MQKLSIGFVLALFAFSAGAVDIVCGTTELNVDADPSNQVPSVVIEKAAFWMDMDDSSVVSEDGATLSMWRDRRETAEKNENPTMYYAVPAWTNGGETVAVSYDYAGVNPAIETLGSVNRRALNFHGRSGVYLRLMKDGAQARLYRNVRHVFAVHNPSNWFGAVVGGMTDNREGAYLLSAYDMSYVYDMSKRESDPIFWNRVDLGELGYLSSSIRFAVDGEAVDQFSYRPHQGWQLLDTAFAGSTHGGTVETIFYQRYENLSAENLLMYSRAGGDCLSELMVFTNQLSVVEIEDIRAYLNAKWKLPDWRNSDCDANNANNYLMPLPASEPVVIASGAEALASVDTGVASRPFAFSGEGRVSKVGEGSLVIGATPRVEPFSGEFDLTAGSVLLRGGLPPALKALPGRALTSEDYVQGDNTPTNQSAGGVRLAVVDGAGSSVFVKKGGCPAVVKDVDPRVSEVRVESGELTLGAATKVGYRGEIPVENGDFEESYFCLAGDDYYSQWAFSLRRLTPDGLNGWFCTQGSPVYFQRVGRGCKFEDGSPVEEAETSDGRKWIGSSAWNLETTVGTGKQVLNIQNGAAYTKVWLPSDGCYEIEFDLSERYSLNKGINNARPVVVLLGSSPEDWVPFAYGQGTSKHWTNLKVTTPWRAAGEYVIGFQPQNLSVVGDCSIYIDNVRMRYSSNGPCGTYAIPNGNFEKMDLALKDDPVNYWSVNYYSLENVAEGWTFEAAPWGSGEGEFNPSIGLVNPNMNPRWRSWCEKDGNTPILGTRQGAIVWGRDVQGTTALLMVGGTGKATTTFTPPAGTWYLRHRLSRAFVCANDGNMNFYSDVEVTISAKVLIGGQELDLGTVKKGTRDAVPFKGFDYPTTFTADGMTPVTLTVINKTTNVGALLDDFELVREGSFAVNDGELVKCGDFEQNQYSFWTRHDVSMPPGQQARRNNGASFMKYLNSVTFAYGAMRYDGLSFCLLKNLCGISQEIEFPSAGLYRLRFALRSRADLSEYAADGDLAVKMWRGDVTNNIAFINYQNQRNFTEREYVIRVSNPGRYVLAFESYGPHAGRGNENSESTCLLDGVSIRRIDWGIPESLSMNSNARIVLGKNATLNLAFTGTNVISSLRHDGHPVVGCAVDMGRIISAETCPEIVSGPGTLLVKPRGLTIVVH